MKVLLVCYDAYSETGPVVVGVASNIEEAWILTGKMVVYGEVYGGKFSYREVEVDQEFSDKLHYIVGKEVDVAPAKDKAPSK